MKPTLIILLGLISTFNLFSQEIGAYESDDNTVVLMNFDGDLNNNSILSDGGIPHGSGISFSADTHFNSGQCLNLDGQSYITISHNANLNLSSDWTIELWFRPTEYNTVLQYFVQKPGDADSYFANYALQINPYWDNSLVGFFFNATDRIYVADSKPNLNQWYHISYFRDVTNSLIKIVLRDEDLEIVSTNSYTFSGTDVLLSSQDLRIGEGFIGDIDEFRISNVVRDFSFKLDKAEITSENFIVYYDQEHSDAASTIIEQVQHKTNFYKKYFKYFFLIIQKTFPINICKDLAEFNQVKPSDLPDFETSYLYKEILYVIAPTTTSQLAYFDDFEQAVMHGFAKMFIDDEYDGTASEWMKYGFARHQAGMNSTPEEIRAEINNLGRNPTMQEMNNWDQITSFNKYAFAYTIFQYVADVHSFNYIFNQIKFNNNAVQYGFRQFNTEEKFEEAWHYSLDVFYLRETKRMEFQRQTAHYNFYLVDEDLSEIDQWANELEEYFSRFTSDMQMTLDQKINVYFYPDICDYHHIQGNDDCPVGSCGEALGIDLAKFTRVYEGNSMMQSVGLAKHELTHVIHMNLEFGHNPAWLLEGLACLMPDGLFAEEDINGASGVIKEQVNVGFSEVVAAAGRYPSIDDFESQDFVNEYADDNLMYYLLGTVVTDYLLKASGYMELKSFIESDAKDYTMLGFADQTDFMNSFYTFYEENWKIKAQSATAAKINSIINIDGNIDESEWNLNNDIKEVYPFYQNWFNNTAKYGALWDSDYLYIAVEVIDNALVNNSSEFWNDGAEIFIDPDFNKAYQYDSFDRHFTKSWNNAGLIEKNNHTSGVLHSVKNMSGGYVIEMAIPWDNLGITPIDDEIIGFDISNIDKDNNAQYRLIWSGNNFNDGTTINFGELTLLSMTNEAPTANFSSNFTSGVLPLSIEFSDQSTQGTGAITQWNWDFGDGEASTDENPSHIYVNAGTYSVSLTVTDEYGLSNTQVKTDYISVFALPENLQGPQPQNEATAVSTNPTLTWTNGSNTDQSDLYFGTTNPPTQKVLSDASATRYQPSTLTYSTTYFWKVVNKNTVGNTEGPVWSFTVDVGTGIFDYAKDQELKMYPNPAIDQVFISSPEKVDLNIYNISGQCVLEQKDFLSGKINISDFNKGTYIVTFTNRKGRITKQLIIK